jgi:hypothetical protein
LWAYPYGWLHHDDVDDDDDDDEEADGYSISCFQGPSRRLMGTSSSSSSSSEALKHTVLRFI